MSLTYADAMDEIYAVLQSAWPTEYPMHWPDVAGFIKPAGKAWGRVAIRFADGFQVTLSDENGTRRWRRVGTLAVQVFAPLGDGEKKVKELAQLVTDAYEGKYTPGGVWFRNTRIAQVGPQGDDVQYNVMSDFQYDQCK